MLLFFEQSSQKASQTGLEEHWWWVNDRILQSDMTQHSSLRHISKTDTQGFYVKQTWNSIWKSLFLLWEKTFPQRRSAGAVGHSGQFSGVERQTRVPVALLVTFAQGSEERGERRGKQFTQSKRSSAASQNTLRQALKKKDIFKIYV